MLHRGLWELSTGTNLVPGLCAGVQVHVENGSGDVQTDVTWHWVHGAVTVLMQKESLAPHFF